MPDQPAPFAQRSRKRIAFDHREMDYYLSWILGRAVYEGARREECLQLASQITDGDPQSWQRAWIPLAEQTEQSAAASLSAGDHQAARLAFLRACTCHRAPMFLMHPEDPLFAELGERMRSCFRRAAALFAPPIRSIEVDYHGVRLPGYFWPPDTSTKPHPTLIVIGGIETFVEDCWFMLGTSAARHGFNLLTVDLPGQGFNPGHGLVFGAQMEQPVQAVLDHACGRPEVDPVRLARHGFSWGGHVVLKGAEHDPRVGALIANPPMPDVFRAALGQQAGQNRKDPIARLVFEQIAWRLGLRISANLGDLARRFAKAYDYLAHGKADVRHILCPCLLLAGEGEAPITLTIAREMVGRLTHPMTRLHIFTGAEGGEAHCQVDNLELPNNLMFDWLASVWA